MGFLKSNIIIFYLLLSQAWPSRPPRTAAARCPKVLTCGSRRTTATRPPPTAMPPPQPHPPSRPLLPRRPRRQGARLVPQASRRKQDQKHLKNSHVLLWYCFRPLVVLLGCHNRHCPLNYCPAPPTHSTLDGNHDRHRLVCFLLRLIT